jgi:hypothetical protein
MKFVLLICALYSNIIFGQEIKIGIVPQEPVLNESFNVEFRISTNDDVDPNINFNPSGVEVMGKTDQIVSTKTMYVNGRLSMSREIVVSYEMMATRSGTVSINDIEVELNGRIEKHPNIRINVLSKPKELEDIILIADVPKKSVFKGESILVRYYLLNKIPVSTFDIKTFPKLNNFLKRFHDEKLATDRVNFEGEVYERRVLYTTQLFPEKVGKLKVDPLRIEVNYPVRRNDPFGGLGLGLGYQGMKTRALSSKSIEVEVLEVPKDKMPSSFSGLIGDHDIKFEISRSKFVVNEPIELKLTISGDGALETFEAPKILNSTNLEEFETNNDLIVQKNFTATKQFDYTYLARNAERIPGKNLEISFFDPKNMKYITKTISIPEVLIQGGGGIIETNKNSVSKPDETNSALKEVNVQRALLAPSFTSSINYLNIKIVNYFLILILISVLSFKSYNLYKKSGFELNILNKKEVDVSEILSAIKQLDKTSTKSLEFILLNSSLKQETKKYFHEVLNSIFAQYSPHGKNIKIKMNKIYFKELLKVVNENNQKS